MKAEFHITCESEQEVRDFMGIFQQRELFPLIHPETKETVASMIISPNTRRDEARQNYRKHHEKTPNQMIPESVIENSYNSENQTGIEIINNQICEGCGKPFLKKRANQKTCSKSCWQKRTGSNKS